MAPLLEDLRRYSNARIRNSRIPKPLPNPFGYRMDLGAETAQKKLAAELEMIRLSAGLRRQPFWWTKFRDPQIVAEWRAEALAQAEHMDESHVNYVLEELDGYANLRDEVTGAEISCHDCIWQSDRLIPAELRQRLLANVAKLENVPETEKDWHPRSNEQVLDLVHPSLYPIVYGRTLSFPENTKNREPNQLKARIDPPVPMRSLWGRQDDNYISQRFQWLPTDFRVSKDGKSVKSCGYINNLHPIEHAELQRTIEELIAACIPLFERTLTDMMPENQAAAPRTFLSQKINEEGDQYRPLPSDSTTIEEHIERLYEWQKIWQTAQENLTRDYEPGSLEDRWAPKSLAGKKIQVFVKLTNIHLTPDKPTYAGSSWYVEGTVNESIAVCGVYYYDEENITESRLDFHAALVSDSVYPDDYEQEDHRNCMLSSGAEGHGYCGYELGSVATPQHRCIAFPNTYQHRISPFELVDKSKPGHRKILSLFLVDPAVRLTSTEVVPPQQKEWRASAIAANPVLKAAFDKLAPEIIDRIDGMAGGVMTREEAEQYRLELMDERALTWPKEEDGEMFLMSSFSVSEY